MCGAACIASAIADKILGSLTYESVRIKQLLTMFLPQTAMPTSGTLVMIIMYPFRNVDRTSGRRRRHVEEQFAFPNAT